jgi:hypothetical protein
VAIVQFVDLNGREAINAATQGLPTSKTIVWAVVLQQRVGPSSSGASTRPTTRVTSCWGQLPGVSTLQHKDLVITREAQHEPDVPGTIYLRGSIQNAAGG